MRARTREALVDFAIGVAFGAIFIFGGGAAWLTSQLIYAPTMIAGF